MWWVISYLQLRLCDRIVTLRRISKGSCKAEGLCIDLWSMTVSDRFIIRLQVIVCILFAKLSFLKKIVQGDQSLSSCVFRVIAVDDIDSLCNSQKKLQKSKLLTDHLTPTCLHFYFALVIIIIFVWLSVCYFLLLSCFACFFFFFFLSRSPCNSPWLWIDSNSWWSVLH